jgi:hypothetical protein
MDTAGGVCLEIPGRAVARRTPGRSAGSRPA